MAKISQIEQNNSLAHHVFIDVTGDSMKRDRRLDDRGASSLRKVLTILIMIFASLPGFGAPQDEKKFDHSAPRLKTLAIYASGDTKDPTDLPFIIPLLCDANLQEISADKNNNSVVENVLFSYPQNLLTAALVNCLDSKSCPPIYDFAIKLARTGKLQAEEKSLFRDTLLPIYFQTEANREIQDRALLILATVAQPGDTELAKLFLKLINQDDAAQPVITASAIGITNVLAQKAAPYLIARLTTAQSPEIILTLSGRLEICAGCKPNVKGQEKKFWLDWWKIHEKDYTARQDA